jgi:hypothetical protein
MSFIGCFPPVFSAWKIPKKEDTKLFLSCQVLLRRKTKKHLVIYTSRFCCQEKFTGYGGKDEF